MTPTSTGTKGRPRLPSAKRASCHLMIRVTPARKAAYQRASRGPLSRWIVTTLDAAAGLGDLPAQPAPSILNCKNPKCRRAASHPGKCQPWS